MKILARLRALVQPVLQDLFSEETAPAASTGPLDQLAGLCQEAEARLAELRQESIEAVARRKRVELAWQQSLAETADREAEVDAALRNGQEELARTRLIQANARQARAREFTFLHQACTDVVDQIAGALAEQQARLKATRQQLLEMGERDRDAAALEALLGQRRSQARRDAELAEGLAAFQEQVARREDRLAARADLNRPSGA